MAGVIPKKTSGRKQWSIQGTQRTSLKRLRSQLASDGCPESQVVLAKQLLDEECEYKTDQKENARLAVYWLIKASDQGNLEATDLLKSCLKTGKGISEHNYLDVKACISTSQDEKIVKRAAKEIFASLSNGGEYITSNQLQRKILAIERGENCSSKSTETRDLDNDCGDANEELVNDMEEYLESDDDDTDWSLKSDCSNEKLTEDSLVSAAVTFSNGQLPFANNAICLTAPDLKALDRVPFIYWSIVNPILSIKITYFKLMKYLASKTIPLPLARTDVQLLMFFLIYSLVSFEDISLFLPTVIFYLSFVTMVVTTFQLLQIQRELHDFRLWRGLFICYSNGGLNEHCFETQFILNHTKPYVWFFLSLLLHYFIYSLTPLKLESEFAVISCCLMLMTLIGFMPNRCSKMVLDSLVLLSFAVNVLARYPYDTDPIVSRGWRFLELHVPSFPSYVVGNGIEFCISFRLLLYTLIPVILFRMATKDKWRGSYQTVLPHLVTLSWLQYFALCSQSATMFGLYRAILALVGSFLFLPLVGLTSVIVPVVALTKWIITSNIIYTISLFVFLLAICLAVCFLCARTRYAHYTAALQVILMVIAFLALMRSSGRSQEGFMAQEQSKMLNWDVFQKLCHKGVREHTENVAEAQVRCARLEGTQVLWEGTVGSVNLVSIKNNYKSIFDKLPNFIANQLYCLFGHKETTQCEQEESVCTFLEESGRDKCNLNEYDVYSFEVTLEMPTPFWRFTPEVHLSLSDHFRNFSLGLKEKDLVWFKGVLFNNFEVGQSGILGTSNSHVRVTEIGCISCANQNLASAKIEDKITFLFGLKFLHKVYDAFKFVLNIMFSPVLVFK